jgi:uncharacterized protein
LSQPTSYPAEFTIDAFLKKLRGERKLFLCRCKKCGYEMIPPRPVCSRCLGRDLEWAEVPREGKILSFSEVYVSSDRFQKLVPYVVCIAEFGAGLKIPGIVRASPSALNVGSTIVVVVEPGSLPEYFFVEPDAYPIECNSPPSTGNMVPVM